MNNKLRITGCLVALVCNAPLVTNGAIKKSPSPGASPSVTPKPKSSATPKTTPSPSPSPSAHPTVGRAIPFHGKISAVDQKAKTFTIAGKEKSRVFKITDKTVMTNAGAPATMKDVVANEEARGSYWKVMDGTLEAKTVKLGPKTDAEKAADEKAKARKKEKEAAAESSASPLASPKP